jgi:hypothetical protein
MEDEKKVEEKTQESEEQEAPKAPIITRSMAEATMEEGCATCDAAAEPVAVPQNLPELSWSTEKLVESLQDKHVLVRTNALMLLSKRSPPEAMAIEPIIQALKDDDYLVKSNAMMALAAYGKDISDRIMAALSDPDPGIRAGAAWILGELKDSKAIESLEMATKDENPLVRVQAKASLQAMGRWPSKTLGDKKQDVPAKEETPKAEMAEGEGPQPQ